MKKYCVSLILLFLGLQTSEAQNEVLFSIDNKPFYTDEFVRIYNKNLDLVKDDSQKNLDNYFDLFLGYKLKVNKAYTLGLDKSEKYMNELKSYRTQLSKNYMSDSKVTQSLIDEAYQRSLKEINASHILILVDENANPQDTLIAFNKIVDIKKEIEKGVISFEEAAKKYSQDPSAIDNKGNLGYFSVFRMVYPFESAAFNTQKNKISKPVRTKFGYHLIFVNDSRDNRGEVTVAHIMIMDKKDENGNDISKNTIEDIYKKYKQGEKFEALAQQFSDDKSSAPKGGQMQRFGSGQLSSEEFEAVAFSLKEKNEVSTPFKSQFGWHIVKLIEKHAVKTLEESKFELENKIKRDERSKILTNSLLDKLHKKYTIVSDKKTLDKIKASVGDAFYKAEWNPVESLKNMTDKLITIDSKNVIAGSKFVDFLLEQHKLNSQVKPINLLIDKYYKDFLDQQLTAYYDNNLESEIKEFKYIMDEYREGLLLFDLMEKEIWDRAKNDTIGQLEFYNKNIAKYQWKKRFNTQIYSSTNKKELGKAHKLVKKNIGVEEVKSKLNTNEKVNIMVQSGVYEENDKILPKTLNYQKGLSDIVFENNYYFFANTKEVIPAGPKDLTESKGKVVNDYQQYLESNWVDELKKEVKININKEVLEKVRKQLNN